MASQSGATFDFARIRAELDRETFKEDYENPGTLVRRVWLGTIYAISPSGKFYTPFACSNVAGDCPVCKGSGTRPEPRTGRRVRARARRRQHDLCRGVIGRGTMGAPAGRAYAKRVQSFRDRAFRVTDTTCKACFGEGSISAARDQKWQEALEEQAEAIGAFVDWQGDDVFVAECGDAPETDDESDDYGDEPGDVDTEATEGDVGF